MNPTDLPLHTTTWLTALPLCTSPLARDRVTGPWLEKKRAFTKWTTFTGFLFPFPQTLGSKGGEAVLPAVELSSTEKAGCRLG